MNRKFAQITRFLDTIRFLWCDSRVSMFARLLILMIPIYWAFPWDLMPDCLAHGYVDDVCLIPLMFLAAWRTIPKVVFQDAKQSAFLKQQAALLGLLYVTTAGFVPCHASARHIDDTPTYQVRSASSWLRTPGHKRDWSVEASYRECSSHVQSKTILKQPVPRGRFHKYPVDLLQKHYLASAVAPETKVAGCEANSFACCDIPQLLLTRAGQRQLYASEDVSASKLDARSRYSLGMPQRSVCGIAVRKCSEPFTSDLETR